MNLIVAIIFSIISFILIFIGIVVTITEGSLGVGFILMGVVTILILAVPFYINYYEEYKELQKNKTPTPKQDSVRWLIDDYIERVVYNFNAENQPGVSISKVKEMFYNFNKEEIKQYKTTTDVNNRHFGIMAIALMCCTILNDEVYQTARNHDSILDGMKEDYGVEIPEEKRQEFLSFLDRAYLSQLIKNFANEEDKGINYFKLFDSAIELYKKENI